MRKLALMLAMLFLGTPALAEDAPVEVMVLGTYHMGNPGKDLANVAADDVTSPKRQREIAAVTEAIARWKPTKIAIEREAPAPFTVADYHAFTPAKLTTDRNEIVQIGFRLAHHMGHRDVYAFDERGGPGEPEYFPFDKVEAYAKAHGQEDRLAALLGYFQGTTKALSDAQSGSTVAQLLMLCNDPARYVPEHEIGYLGMLPFGDGDQQPGAELAAYWYMRNVKMFAKVMLITEPGDRVLVLVGSGHAYWLNDLAAHTPGFRRVDPLPWLRSANGQ